MKTASHIDRSADALQEPAPLSGRWTICAMLFVATSINYVDRQVLAILKPVLAGATLHLSPFFPGWPTVEPSIGITEIQYGYIVDCFQIAYGVGVIFAGQLVDRVGCRVGYPVVTAVWSLAAMGHALVRSVFGFGVARFFLGLGESGNFPAAIKAVAEWFPPRERSLATAILNSGASVGVILAFAIVPWVALHFGWRAAFLTTGIFSAGWIVWWSLTYRTPCAAVESGQNPAEASSSQTSLPWWKLLGFRQTWGYFLAKFLTDPVWWFYLFWMPSYFNARFKLDLSHLGLPLIIVYVVCSLGGIFGGWLPHNFVRLGMDLKSARLAAMLTCACCVLPIVFAGGLRSEWLAVGLLSLATSIHQGWSANMFTTVSDMFPRAYVGTVVSFGQVGGALGGTIFATVAGHILQLTHSYVPLFFYSAFAYLLALVILRALAPGLKSVNIPN